MDGLNTFHFPLLYGTLGWRYPFLCFSVNDFSLFPGRLNRMELEPWRIGYMNTGMRIHMVRRALWKKGSFGTGNRLWDFSPTAWPLGLP